MLKRLLADKAFLRRILLIAFPILLQNSITNFVSLLDNIMVGQVGTIQMSGVAIVNQLLFVFNLIIFGATSGAGIFTAQFFGSGDQEGMRYTFRFKIIAGIVLSGLGIALFLLFGDNLISLYLQSDSAAEDTALTLQYGREYLLIMLWGFLPFALTNGYAGTLRETNQTVVPMLASIAAVLTNLGLNYVLIFGHFGAPALGVQGAAIATVVSRYLEFLILFLWTKCNAVKNPFIIGAYRSLYLPGKLLRQIFIKGMPLTVNEALWSTGIATLSQCYSTRGLDVVAANNIASTLNNLASVIYLSLSVTVGIIIGQMLGANNTAEDMKRTSKKLNFLIVTASSVFGILMMAVSGIFPLLYNTTETVRTLAGWMICVIGILMPVCAYNNCAYFTLRAGGQTMTTFWVDSGFMWFFAVPLAFCLSRFTALPILPLFAICNAADLIKCFIAGHMLNKGHWIQNLAKK